MLFKSHASCTAASIRRKATVFALLSASTLFAPLTAAAVPAMHHHAWTTSEHRPESLEKRITTLHANLQITPAEEADWSAVAQVMRDNEAHMQAMIAAHRAEGTHHVDAPEDLRTYERFTQAHVDGLKQLRSSFETLYATMPAGQKLVADEVFHKFGHRHETHA